MLVTAVLAGCGEVRRQPFGALSVTVAPGETGVCHLAPCTVSLVMPPAPPGAGLDFTWQVTGNQIDFGRYPAGATANLGNFYEPLALRVVGAGVPRAFVYLPVLP